MKTEEEIIKALKKVEQEVKCKRCGAICDIDYDGDLSCPKCSGLCGGTWMELGVYNTLRWVLGLDNSLEKEYWFEGD
jgi:DNA-directed RNA polymerase subunit RPC12/RpoP